MSKHIMSQFLRAAAHAFSMNLKTFTFMGKMSASELLDATKGIYAACSELGAICSLSENAGKVEVYAL